MAGRGGCSGARERRRRGPGGPEPHPEHSGEVSLAGDGTAVANFAAAARGSGEESAVTPGAPARFLWPEGGGRHGGAGGELGGGRGGS
jgi:hypothetical protein